MIKHYFDLVFSKIVEKNDYTFKNPTFGKSNTDQSYYEPMASMVQNLSRSAGLSSSIHNDSEKSISKIRAESDFLPQNLTQEEIQSFIIKQTELTESAINDVNEQLNLIKDEVYSNDLVVEKTTKED